MPKKPMQRIFTDEVNDDYHSEPIYDKEVNDDLVEDEEQVVDDDETMLVVHRHYLTIRK